MRFSEKDLLLYAVTDRSWLRDLALSESVAEALEGGVACVQLREKRLTGPALEREAAEIQGLCRRYGVPFIVNDDVELAIRLHADGVHVGQSDMRADDVRALIGDGMTLGVSVQTVGQALEAVWNGADYLGVGAVFPTTTKEDADAVSLETLREICRAVSVPVVAIGGITARNIPKLANTGIAGIALVSEIFAKPGIGARCRELRRLAEKVVFAGREKEA